MVRSKGGDFSWLFFCYGGPGSVGSLGVTLSDISFLLIVKGKGLLFSLSCGYSSPLQKILIFLSIFLLPHLFYILVTVVLVLLYYR